MDQTKMDQTERDREKMKKKKLKLKVLHFMTGVSSVIILGLFLTTLFTSNWTECIAKRNVTGMPDVIDNAPNDKYTGFVRFGVIWGYKQFNYGYGPRDVIKFDVVKEYKDVYNTNMVIVAISFLGPAIIFAVVSASFCVMNFRGVPVETLHGRPGLYLWNAIGFVSSCVSMSVYIALYLTEIKYNALSLEDQNEQNGFIMHQVYLGYSFWLLVTGVVLYFCNIGFILLTQLIEDPPKCLMKRHRTADLEQPSATELKNVMVY